MPSQIHRPESDNGHPLLCEQEIQSLLDAAPHAFFLLNPDGSILLANAAMAARLRCPLEAIRGVDAFGQDEPKVAEHRRAMVRRVVEMGRPVSFTDRQQGRTFENTVYPLPNRAGDLVRLVFFSRDITARKQMEDVLLARLRLSEAATSLPIDRLLQRFLDEAEILTGSCVGFFHFFESDQQTISLQTWSSNTLGLCRANGKGLHYHLDTAGFWADCIRERRPIIHNAYATLPNKKGLPSGHVPVIRELVVPLFRKGRIVAVFGVGNKSQDYDERDVEIVSTLGDMAWDIVLRRKEEDALRESETRFRKIYEHMGVGVARVSLDFRIQAANAAYCRMLGYREEELIGMHLRDITHPEVIEENLERQRQLGAGLIDHYSMEKRFLHKDGHTVYGLLNASLIRDAEGNPSYFLGSVADITERKTAEGLLREESERWQMLFEKTRDGIVILDETAKVYAFNRRFADMLGYSPEEIEGMYAWDWDAHFSKEQIQEMARSIDDDGHHFETLHRCKDGRIFPVELSNSRTIYRGQKLILCICRDISERKAAEAEKQALEARNRQLQKAESLGRMAGAIAHLFNNQLYVVTGNLEMAMEDLRKGIYSDEFLVAALHAARRAADMCRLMQVYLGRPSMGHLPIDLSEVCRQSLAHLQDTLPQNVLLETDFPMSGPFIRADAYRIRQALAHLVANAWESFSDGPGRIRLVVKTVSADHIPVSGRFPVDWQPSETAYACLEVSDNGCGISEKDIEKLFDPFYTTKFIGRGLGLPVVMGIVKAHGGAIIVQTEIGRGSTLMLCFPLDTPEKTEETH
uniref:histidine kinase n=1 Tax=Desulfatirhabdium butyrativorans TaxID=340467 RepID=A0A7C4VS62_9BACT